MRKKIVYVALFYFVLNYILRIPVYANIIPIGPVQRFMMSYPLIVIAIVYFLNIISELFVLYQLGLKEKRVMIAAFFSNLLSWPIFRELIGSARDLHVHFTLYVLVIILLEVFVVFFETLFIYLLNRTLKFKELFKKVLLANLFSAIIVSPIINIIIVFAVTLI